MITCDICSRQVEAVVLQVNKIGSPYTTRYCDTCWYNKNEPIMILTKLWDSMIFDIKGQELSNLFSPKLGKNVYPAVGQMKCCGFRLVNRKVYFNEEVNKRYREVLTYKYSGNLRCLALSGYTSWPSKMKKCHKIGCNLY